MTPEINQQYPSDQARKGETSLMPTLYPEAVDMGKHNAENW
jgi:hypothetical protein